MAASETEILQGWEAIAEFLGCDVRTAKRWETNRGLPVRRRLRTPGARRADVYALKTELEGWTASAQSTENWAPPSPAPDASQTAPDPGATLTEAPTEAPTAAPVDAARPHRGRTAAAWIAAIAVCLTVVAVLWAREHEPGWTAKRATAELRMIESSHRLAAASSAGPDVQELYLHGSYLLEQRTPETLAQAKRDFEQAIAANADYAPGYAGLARVYDLVREYGTVPSAEAYPKAKQAAQRAIALDPRLADAHAALGYEEFFWEWKAQAAENEFRQAIALDPNSGVAHHWYGSMLMHEGRLDEAMRELQRAQVLEPASAAVLATRAYAMGLSGRIDEARGMVEDVVRRAPDSAPVHFILAQLALEEPRDLRRYLDELRLDAQLRHSDQERAVVDRADAAFRRAGERAMWQAVLDEERRLHPHGEPTYTRARAEAMLEQKDAAFADLRSLSASHDDGLIGLEIDAALRGLHDDPRFDEIAQSVGLPPLQSKD